MGTRLDRPAFVAVLAAAAAAAVIGAVVVAGGGDVSRIVHAAPPFADPARVPASLRISPPPFDGQFYYRLAVAPLDTSPQVAGITLDIPALRHQRVLYPALAWALSAGGRAPAVPWALAGLNVAAAAALGGAAAAIARSSGRHAAWGLLAAAFPGFVYTLTHDLTELTASALMVAGLLAIRRERFAAATVAMSLAVLARETTAVVPAALAATGAWRLVRGRAPSAAAATGAAGAALMTAVAWQAVLWGLWDRLGLAASGSTNLRFPFVGLVSRLDRFVPVSAANAFRLGSLLLLAGVIAAAAVSRRAPAHEKAALALAAGVLSMLGEFSWSGATSFMRSGTEAFVLGTLVLMRTGRLTRWAVAIGVAALWGLTVLSEVVKASGSGV